MLFDLAEWVGVISTRAPTRGATRPPRWSCPRRSISTRAPTRGATCGAARRRSGRRYFYSRPYARGDTLTVPNCAAADLISTHAPTRGATNVRLPSAVLSEISTHAPTRGATRRPGTCCTPREFLLAPLREGRPDFSTSMIGSFDNFYSRPYARGDGDRRARRHDALLHFYSRPYARGDSNFSQNHKLIYMINC